MQEDYKEIIEMFAKSLLSAICAIILLILMCALCGCRTVEYLPVERVSVETVQGDSSLYLSIIRLMREREQSRQRSSDSLIIRYKERTTVNADGDTLRTDTQTETYRSSSRETELARIVEMQSDSIRDLQAMLRVQRRDSVPVPYPVEKIVEVERKRPWWETGILWGAGIMLFLGLIVSPFCYFLRVTKISTH